MLRPILCGIAIFVLVFCLVGCVKPKKEVKIGVSFGVGNATRWVKEKAYMEERAQELGIDLELRLNKTDKPKTQEEDCREMIDSGIDVLILTPRNIENMRPIISYAKEKKVKVISYSRVALREKVDLFVGYDCDRMGQALGQYLSEMVYKGDYILLKGDPRDYNAILVHDGAMRYISPIKDNINIILDTFVAGWSADEAKKLVLEAIKANGNKVDAILAPNDKIAGACAEALAELNITDHVVITGMDAELDAIKRIVADKQDMTIYLNLQELAYTAIDEAYHMATNQKVNINAKFDNESERGIDANLIVGKVITKENVDRMLIKTGYFSKEEVYGENKE